jgi:hypothetical protein
MREKLLFGTVSAAGPRTNAEDTCVQQKMDENTSESFILAISGCETERYGFQQ